MDTILLTVTHNGKEQEFEVMFRSSAYTYSFVLELNGHEVRFEPDEERNLRAIVAAGVQHGTDEYQLIALIGEELARMLN